MNFSCYIFNFLAICNNLFGTEGFYYTTLVLFILLWINRKIFSFFVSFLDFTYIARVPNKVNKKKNEILLRYIEWCENNNGNSSKKWESSQNIDEKNVIEKLIMLGFF